MGEILINSDQAYDRLLMQVLDKKFRVGKVRFEKWPMLTMRLSGEQLNGTMPTWVMPYFMDVQKSLYHAYAYEVHDKSTQRLSEKERRALILSVKIDEGSSLFTVDFSSALVALFELLGDMDPSDAKDIIIAGILGIPGMYFTYAGFKHYVSKRYEERKDKLTHDFQVKMTEEETRRHQILAQIMSPSQMNFHTKNAGEVHNQALRAISKAESGKMGDIVMRGEQAAALAREPRRQSDQVRLDGVYRIMSVDVSDATTYRLRLQRLEDGLNLPAEIKSANLKPKMKGTLQSAEWEHRIMQVEINADAVYEDGKISGYRNAVVVSAEILDDTPPA